MYFDQTLISPSKAGTIGENGVILPQALPLTSERLERHGLFLIEDGQTIFLWVGRDAVPQLVQDVFDLPSYDVLRGGKACIVKCILFSTFLLISLSTL
jgi:protein transport protein SEC24